MGNAASYDESLMVQVKNISENWSLWKGKKIAAKTQGFTRLLW